MVAGSAASQVYRWTDDKGRTHYGAEPPPGANAQALSGKAALIPAPKHAPTEAELRRQREAEAESRQRDERERAALMRKPEVQAYCAKIAEQLRAMRAQHPEKRQQLDEADAEYRKMCG